MGKLGRGRGRRRGRGRGKGRGRRGTGKRKPDLAAKACKASDRFKRIKGGGGGANFF